MQIGMIGLGRMGAGLVERLLAGGHECVVFDANTTAVRDLEGAGAIGADSPADLASRLVAPRAIWVMVPAAAVATVVDALAEHLEPDDIIIDGGNSFYRDDVDRAEALAGHGLHYVDVGTSGGVFGNERGFSLMIGGEDAIVRHLDPIFATLAPGVGAAPRTPSRTSLNPSTAETGYLHCGPAGAGHFVKMVHNGVEYGMMAALAEGLAILKAADVGTLGHPKSDAETAPLRDPKHYSYDFDLPAVTEVWRRGSVVASWLLDLTADALHREPNLDGRSGRVADSGEGRWTVLAAVDEGVSAPVLTAALYDRFSSREGGDFGHRVLSAMRGEFGGHQDTSSVPPGASAPAPN